MKVQLSARQLSAIVAHFAMTEMGLKPDDTWSYEISIHKTTDENDTNFCTLSVELEHPVVNNEGRAGQPLATHPE